MSQIIIITHSATLAELVSGTLENPSIELVLDKGATRLKEDLGVKKVWRFD